MRGRTFLAGAFLLSAALAGPSSATAVASAPCQVIGFSPSFATDGTALCAHQDYSDIHALSNNRGLAAKLGPVVPYVTTDFGQHWRTVRASGLPTASTQHFSPTLTQVIFSPLYAVDHAVYLWAATDGLFRSTDLGVTWTQAQGSPPSGEPGTGSLSPFVVTAPAQPGEQGNPRQVGAFLYAYGGLCAHGAHPPTDALVIFPTFLPVYGGTGCSDDTLFITPKNPLTEPVLLVGYDFTKKPAVLAVSQCNAALVCPTATYHREGMGVRQAWTDPSSDRAVYLDLVDGDYGQSFSHHLLTTTDRGAHWTLSASADRLLKGRIVYSLGLGISATGQRLTMRASSDQSRSDDLGEGASASGGGGERLWSSSDFGRTWHLIGTSPGFGGKGPSGPGTLPFNAPYGYTLDRGGVWEQGGRLFTLAEHDVGATGVENAGVWCSVDSGHTWTPRCAH